MNSTQHTGTTISNVSRSRKSNGVVEGQLSPVSAMPRGISDARKKLRWLIGNPPENLALPMEINPSMASAMMQRNVDHEWRNRPQSEKGLRRYVAAMRRGWKYTGETIVFSKSGRLLNGQHRLMACIEAGVAFPCLVAFGVDDDVFVFMDIGIARTAGHIFAIEDIPNYNYAASVVRILHAYYSRPNWDGRPLDRVENEELLDFYWQHQGVQESHKFARMMLSEGLLPQRWAGAVHYICAQKNRAEADAFFKRVATGIDQTSKTAPDYLIRKRLLENARTGPTDKAANIYLAAYTIQAWNAHRKGEKRSLFRWRGGQNPDEAFPRAI